jgi:predicted esterase
MRLHKSNYRDAIHPKQQTTRHNRTMTDPHDDAPITYAGMPLGQSPLVMIMLHNRDSTADNILALATEFQRPGWTYLAPQATGKSWYPSSMFAPIDQNEPHLSSALQAIQSIFLRLTNFGVSPRQIILLGFGQGASLAAEFAARHAQPFGAVVLLSGALIGPPGAASEYRGNFEGTPIFLGCSDRDPNIPVERVYETEAVLAALGATVFTSIYPGSSHTITNDELARISILMDSVATIP